MKVISQKRGSTMDDSLVMLVDGTNIVMRSHFASMRRNPDGTMESTMTTKDGRDSGAFFLSIKALLTLYSQFRPDAMLWCFDHGKSIYRKDLRLEYKSNRPTRDYNLRPQFDAFDRFLSLINVRHYREHGVEADDLIATAALRWQEESWFSKSRDRIVIVSADHDLRQLVRDDYVLVYKPTMGSQRGAQDALYDAVAVQEKYGIEPERLSQAWALCGDEGDGIVGIRGIGEKTAVKIIKEYGDLSEAVLRSPKIDGHQTLVVDNYLLIDLDGSLATLNVDVAECIFNIEDINKDDLIELFSEWEFNSLIDKVEKDGVKGLFLSPNTK